MLGPEHAAMIVKEVSYETSEPTVNSQVTTLQGTGADVFVIAATPKFAAQAIRKAYDLGWDATRYITDVSLSISSVMKAAGYEKAKGVITANYGKDASDPRWKDDAGFKEWREFAEKHLSANDLSTPMRSTPSAPQSLSSRCSSNAATTSAATTYLSRRQT